jgi:hypothetical protein
VTGNLPLYYFYVALVTHGLLKSACSTMPEGTGSSSDCALNKTTGVNHRRSKGDKSADIPDFSAPVVIQRSGDEQELTKAKRDLTKAKSIIAESKAAVARENAAVARDNAAVARDNTMKTLMVSLKDAKKDLSEYVQSSEYEEDSLEHKVKKRRIELVEGDLGRLIA